jgi:hypothetical protein
MKYDDIFLGWSQNWSVKHGATATCLLQVDIVFIIGIVICIFGLQSIQNAQMKSYLPECKNNQTTLKSCQDDALSTLYGQRNFGAGTLAIGLVAAGISGNRLYKYYRKTRRPLPTNTNS